MNLRVAGAQIPVTVDIEKNVNEIVAAIDRASLRGADILLTPEGSLSGYTHEFDRGRLAEALVEVAEYAVGAGVGLALGTCFEENDGQCYNQLRFYRPDGTYLGFHSKTLRTGTLGKQTVGAAGLVLHRRVKVLNATDSGLHGCPPYGNDPHIGRGLTAGLNVKD